jgi:adenosine deaminase CECR1
MGVSCSNLDKDDSSSEKDAPTHGARQHNGPSSSQSIMSKSVSGSQAFKQVTPRAQTRSLASSSPHWEDVQAARLMINAQHDVVNERMAPLGLGSDSRPSPPTPVDHFSSLEHYQKARNQIRTWEGALAFDYRRTQLASDKEKEANHIIQLLRQRDKAEVYGREPPRLGHDNQKHPRFPGDHFLSDVDLINRSDLYRVAKMMPKGAHLHIHFNCCLQPRFLLDVAKRQPRMFIRSDKALPPGDDLAFRQCEIQFSLLAEGEENLGDIYDPTSYTPGQDMLFTDFLERFPVEQRGDPEQWLEGKLMFSTEETYNVLQTPFG